MIRLIPTSHCASTVHSRMLHTSASLSKGPDPLTYTETLNKIIDFKHSFHPDFHGVIFQHPRESNASVWRNLEMGEKWEKELTPYQGALSPIIEGTIATYNPRLESMIEIGSGRYPITHFLPNLENKDQIHLSEFNVPCLQVLKKKCPQNTIRQINILSPKQTKLSYKTVVMSDVLNAFSKDELGNALRGVNKLLEPGGHLIHFSMREPIFIETIDNLKQQRISYLPVVDKHNLWNGVYVINRAKLVDFIFAQKADSAKNALLEYMSLGSNLQDNFCLQNLGKRDLQLFFDLSKPIEECNGLVEEKILFEERYREDLKTKLDEQNFAVLEFQEKEGNYSGPAIEDRHWDPKANLFFAKQMLRLHSFNDKMPAGQIQERAIVHVLVAQKPVSPAVE